MHWQNPLIPIVVLCGALACAPMQAGETAAKPVTPKPDAPAPMKPAENVPADELDVMVFLRQPVPRPGGQQQKLPYSLELPQEWQPRAWNNDSWVLLGPANVEPAKRGEPANPRLIVVRESGVGLQDPEAVVANIRANSAQSSDWKASLVEVKEIAGVKGVLIQTEYGQGAAARVNLTLKLPLDKGSVDFIAEASAVEFPKFKPLYEHIFNSMQPAKEK